MQRSRFLRSRFQLQSDERVGSEKTRRIARSRHAVEFLVSSRFVRRIFERRVHVVALGWQRYHIADAALVFVSFGSQSRCAGKVVSGDCRKSRRIVRASLEGFPIFFCVFACLLLYSLGSHRWIFALSQCYNQGFFYFISMRLFFF
jgi:hypothetical protein